MNEAPAAGSNGATHPILKSDAARRKFADAFKEAAVARIRKGESVNAVANDIDVVQSVIRRWVEAAGVKIKDGKATKGKVVIKVVKKSKSKAAIRYPEEVKRAAAQRFHAGEDAQALATEIGTTPGSVRDWAKKFRRKYERQVVTASAAPMLAIRDAVTYLKHVKTDMYALLQTGQIKEFEEYHLNTLAALKRLLSIPPS